VEFRRDRPAHQPAQPSSSDTVDLIDTLFPICPIHTVEQVALSLILQDRQLPVRTCDAEVLHYHTFKEFRGDLARFFEHYQGAGTERLLQGWADIDPSLRIVPKREFNALPKWRRKLRRYLGGGWKPLPLAVAGRKPSRSVHQALPEPTCKCHATPYCCSSTPLTGPLP
jgi:hypothetical protein